VKKSRFLPGTKVLGRPDSAVSISMSSVIAVAPSEAMTPRSSTMILAELPAPRGKALAQLREDDRTAVELDRMPLTVAEADVSTRAKFASAHARQVVESWPPEKSTRACSRMGRS